MRAKIDFFGTAAGIAAAGLFIGAAAALLSVLGNPANMGICVACFTRDAAGALGLHRAAAVQYLRPEIPGFVLGSFAAALLNREFRPRAGSSPIVRFLLGAFAMIGALVFLGCPWRAWLRLAGGDLNAIAGILGLAAGILGGIGFLKAGYSLGRNRPQAAASGWIMPLLAVGLLVLLAFSPLFGRDAAGAAVGPVFRSAKGPGSQAAPAAIAAAVAIVVGFLAQRTRFCTVGALRDLALFRDGRLALGVLCLFLGALGVNLATGRFVPGFADQPVAHADGLWNFLGMALSGLAFTLAGGCPGRQIFLSGEGDGDAAVFFLGMLTGAAFAHNFNLASSAAGPSPYGPAATLAGIAAVAAIGFLFREGGAASEGGAS